MEAVPAHLRLVLSAVAYTLGYGAGVVLFVWAARRRGLNTAGVRVVATAALLGGLIGANAVQLIASGAPGKTVIGGIAGGWIAVVLAKRSIGLQRSLGDLFAFGIAGGEALGRFGCFFAGCCYGKVAHLPWAVVDHGAPRHPTQLYSSLAAFATLAIIAWADRRATLPDNTIFYLQGALFCALRFVVEFFRDVPSYGSFTLAQYACMAGFALFVWRLRSVLRTRTSFA